MGQHAGVNVSESTYIDSLLLYQDTIKRRDREAEGLSVGVERGEFDSCREYNMSCDLTAEGNCPINALFTVYLRVGLDNKMKTLRKEGISIQTSRYPPHDISACSAGETC